MSADLRFRICSTIERKLKPKNENSEDKIPNEYENVHRYFIEQRLGRIFKSWVTVANEFEMTDEKGNITHRLFATYEEAETYLVQKYSGGNHTERIGNNYEITFPRFYY